MNITIVILILIIIVQFFGGISEGQSNLRRIMVFTLSFTFLSNLAGQSSHPIIEVHLKDGSSFNGSVIRKEKNGLLIKTKYGDLKIPGNDISSVDITISIKSYDDWDWYLDSLIEELTRNEPPLEDKINDESSEVIETEIKENHVVEITEESSTEDIATSGDESIKEENPVIFIPYDTPPKPLTPIKPVYPELAQEAGLVGTIFVQAFIDAEGRVTQTRILKGISRTGLNESSIEAIRNAKYQPAMYKGEPVGVWMTIPVTYKLK